MAQPNKWGSGTVPLYKISYLHYNKLCRNVNEERKNEEVIYFTAYGIDRIEL